MQTNIFWTGLAYYSLENCLVTTTGAGTDIKSTIIGKHAGKIYQVEYRIRVNSAWETVFFEVKNRHSNTTANLCFSGDGRGNWIMNGSPADQFSGCIDIDIALTPFTNTLPVNRLRMAAGSSQQIRVIYIDPLEDEIKPVCQKYTRLSETEYRYENVPNDFEATITVDAAGLVVDYPSLFTRTAAPQTDFR